MAHHQPTRPSHSRSLRRSHWHQGAARRRLAPRRHKLRRRVVAAGVGRADRPSRVILFGSGHLETATPAVSIIHCSNQGHPHVRANRRPARPSVLGIVVFWHHDLGGFLLVLSELRLVR